MRSCTAPRLPARLPNAAIALARGGDDELVHKLYCPTRKSRDRQAVYEIRTRTVGFILTGLKKDLCIVPADGISFKELLA